MITRSSIARVSLLAVPLVAPAAAQWTLLDDFDAYSTGPTTTATGGAWTSVWDGTANSNIVVTDKGQSLETLGGAAWRGAERDLTGTAAAVAVGETRTYFWQLRPSYTQDGSGWDYDFMMGLSPDVANIDDSNAWQDFSVMPFVNNEATTPFINAEAPGTYWAPLAPDVWFNVWVVIDNDASTPGYDCYVSTGNNAPVLVNVDGAANWRNFAAGVPLNAIGFMAAGNAGSIVTVDNIYHAPGVELTSPIVLPDADSDGLPDAWETANGLDPNDGTGVDGAAGDPDSDGDTNLDEYNAGSDPQDGSSTVDDIDADGLDDAWESGWFGNLAQGPADDPDGDGVDNAAEEAAGSDPTDGFSVPGDSDGDSLADSWELTHFGNLDAGAYEDPDSDGHTNQAESLAGTDPDDADSVPGWMSPGVALMKDAVVEADAYIFDSGAPYGRVVNAVSHQDTPLLSHDGYQYSAWYDYNSSADTAHLVLARRTIDGMDIGNWETFQTSSQLVRGFENDNHNAISLGICPADGTLHLAWDHHGHDLRYRRSVLGLCTTNKAAWGSGMLFPEQDHLTPSMATVGGVTYPHFVTRPDGGMAMTWRTGGSGDGDQLLSHYVPGTTDPGDGVWTSALVFIDRTGSYLGSTSRCPYINGFDYDPSGTIHVTWTWRETPSSSNHDICYAYSTDNGATWRNGTGEVIADTGLGERINLDSPGIAFKPLNDQQLLINQQTQCVDGDGRVHAMMMHRRGDDPVGTGASYSQLGTAYHHYFRNPGGSQWQERRIPPEVLPPGSRPKIGHDGDGNVYAVYLSYDEGFDIVPGRGVGTLVVASASKESQYSDWSQVNQVLVGNEFNGEPLIDTGRLAGEGILSVLIQEDRPDDLGDTVSPLHVYDFAVDVPSPVLPGSIQLSATGDDVLITVFGESGSTYGLETATDFATGWSPVGTAIPGQGALLAFPHVDGWLGARRFYRVSATP